MSRLPKAFVFDLDGCCWDPEMYELWGGGSPFKENKVAGARLCQKKSMVNLQDLACIWSPGWHLKRQERNKDSPAWRCQRYLAWAAHGPKVKTHKKTDVFLDFVEFHRTVQVEGEYSSNCLHLWWAEVGKGVPQEVPHCARGIFFTLNLGSFYRVYPDILFM